MDNNLMDQIHIDVKGSLRGIANCAFHYFINSYFFISIRCDFVYLMDNKMMNYLRYLEYFKVKYKIIWQNYLKNFDMIKERNNVCQRLTIIERIVKLFHNDLHLKYHR